MGINIPSREELIANKVAMEDLAAHFGADSIQYLSVDGLQKAVNDGIKRKEDHDTHCKGERLLAVERHGARTPAHNYRLRPASFLTRARCASSPPYVRLGGFLPAMLLPQLLPISLPYRDLPC